MSGKEEILRKFESIAREPETTFADVLKDKGFEGVGEKIVGVLFRGKIFDLLTEIPKDFSSADEIKPITVDDSLSLEIMRHTCTHMMAQAVKRLFPETQIAIGPTTEDGFFYDFWRPKGFTEEDLEKIQQEMERIKKQNFKIKRFIVSRSDAIELFRMMGENYKVKILEDIKEDYVTIYRQGEFIDLCRGPHVPSTGKVGHFKLVSISTAHWRGDERAPQLYRIRGVAFWRKDELDEHFKKIEEAKKRDHRLLGRQLELFEINEDTIGPGLVLWLPYGAKLRRTIEDFLLKEHEKRGYKLVYTPHIARAKLWEISGHLEHYRENMFPEMTWEDSELSYQLKPMNCPFHIQIFKTKTRSYRELPLRLFEFGTVYRYERPGVLHGLLRVRGFTQDDAHIFARPDQVEDEILQVLELVKLILRVFGFSEWKAFLSTRPEDRVGTDEEWDIAEDALRKALERSQMEYEIDPGEGVFYGPKIDIKVKDALGRVWQVSTVQLDFNLPRRFEVVYMDKDNSRKFVFMIHRAILGSIERFIGILLEHTAGRLPPWVAPVQCVVVNLGTRIAHKFASTLSDLGIRCEVDESSERLAKRIKILQMRKIPVIAVCGKKEEEEGVISLRVGGEQKTLKFTEAVEFVRKLCEIPL